MAFEQIQETIRSEKFDIDNSNDLRIVKEFEAELAPYREKSVEIFGNVLSGFDLYMHEKGLFRYSKAYPTGAVVGSNLKEYHMVVLKKRGLDDLNYRRQMARQHEAERAEAIA